MPPIVHNLPFNTTTTDGLYLRRDKSSGPTENNVFDLGSTTNKWANIYSTNFIGTAVQTLYADVAERFACDYPVTQGDIVTLLGNVEVSISKRELDSNIIGIVSLSPAVAMNSEAGTDATHPYIALSGRVPCKIIGQGKKGDRIVTSATMGVGRAVTASEWVSLSPFCVLGRLLQDKLTEEIELTMVILGAK